MVGDIGRFTEVSYLYPSSFFQFSLPFSMPSYTEEDIQDAIAAYRRGDYPSISRNIGVGEVGQ